MANNSNKLPLPLEGIRVLDVTHIVAGPFCSVVLADMGAEVIKVERPGTGERGRSNGPFVEGPDGTRASARFLGINRNKKSISLELRDPRCKETLLTMVRVSDVLLDNFGPGALERLGLGYEALKEVNPGIIYASITGYGDSDGLRGPYSDWPANNPSVQGMGGWMEVTGAPDGPPQMVGDNMGDSVPGVWAALGVVLALETRRKTGQGQHVDMAMYDCMAAHTTSSVPYYQAVGENTGRARENMISAQITLKANDGYVVLAGAGAEEKWVALWPFVGRAELAQDPRYLGRDISGQFYYDHIVPAIEDWSQHLSKWDVAKQLTEIGFSMGVVQNQADLDQCPQLTARKMIVDAGDMLGGSFRVVRTPIQLTACVDPPAVTPPWVGEHNQEVLCGIGGLTPQEVALLEADGVV
jgi:CoA:oxalate CoA-transferase